MVTCEPIALNPLMNEVEKAACDWNQRYLDGDTPWDKGLASPALEEIIADGHIPVGSDVLIPGCGYGHDVRVIAETGCVAVGMDISESAVAGAKLEHKGTAAMFEWGDLFDPSLAEKKCYDIIWEHTCFCAILPEQRDAYVEAVHRLLKPHGVLIAVFFAFGDDEKGPPFKTNIDTLHRHFEKYFTLEWERRPKRFFPTREGQEWLMCWSRK
jgi:SAM-dependent methyltransferase|tara:strand:+ start:10140 stop:10775 length:636 start_codon:yes stop_codon:yes gene_type:complete